MTGRWVAILALAAASFAGGGLLARATWQPYQRDESDAAQAFREAMATIEENHVAEWSSDKLYRDATQGLLASLDDPYAELLADEAYRRYNQRMAGTRSGLRLQLRTHQGGMVIAGASLRSFSLQAGLDPRDEILAINGVSTEGWTPADAARALEGGKGTIVTLLVRPHGSTKTELRRVARTEIHVSAVSPGVLLSGGTGYLSLHASTEAAPRELREAITALRARGMKRLVLDLRQNPGGLIPQAVAMADLFLDPGDTIALTLGRTPEHSRVYVDRLPQAWPRMPVALLVNRNTASAAELLAGALQDHDRARVVGTSTYGKGVIQTTFPLADEVAVKFTTSRWYTPSGRSIQRSDSLREEGKRYRSSAGRALPAGEGIVPDVEVATARPAASIVVDRGFGTDLPIFEAVLDAYVKELKAKGGAQVRAAVVTPAMMEELWDRLEAAGNQTPRRIYDRIAPYVRETMSDVMVQQVWGEEAALRRRLTADTQVHAAIGALSRVRR